MKQNLANYRHDIAVDSFCRAKDDELTESGLAIKYVYELLDALDTPNDQELSHGAKNRNLGNSGGSK